MLRHWIPARPSRTGRLGVLTCRRFCIRWTFPTAPRCVHVRDQDHDLETSLDMKLIDMCTEALD